MRFGPRPIHSSYLIRKANFVACHQWVFVEKLDMLGYAEEGGTFLVNSPFGPDEIWDRFPREVQQDIIDKHLKVYCIDATEVARLLSGLRELQRRLDVAVILVHHTRKFVPAGSQAGQGAPQDAVAPALAVAAEDDAHPALRLFVQAVLAAAAAGLTRPPTPDR